MLVVTLYARLNDIGLFGGAEERLTAFKVTIILFFFVSTWSELCVPEAKAIQQEESDTISGQGSGLLLAQPQRPHRHEG